MTVIMIAQLIFQLNVTKAVKKEISHCTFYGSVVGTVDIEDRYEKCKRKIIRY
tara:strand:+ start:10472 stop:10630 length:159 start_codon:yes stop_codon:yes gene_type:complete